MITWITKHMIDWIDFDRNNPPNNGQYLIFCIAPNFDSDWMDIARFDDGKWHGFHVPISHDNRVIKYAEINYP